MTKSEEDELIVDLFEACVEVLSKKHNRLYEVRRITGEGHRGTILHGFTVINVGTGTRNSTSRITISIILKNQDSLLDYLDRRFRSAG